VGAAVIIKGTTMGTVTDEQGGFKLSDVPEDGLLVISYVGFESKVMKPVFGSGMTIKMKEGVIMTETVMVPPPPPPPPPPPVNEIIIKSDGVGPSPLIVLDGAITDKDVSMIPSETIASISVLKGETAVKAYGEKGKNGVIEITTKEKMSKEAVIKADPVSKGKEVFFVVEEMPEFPGGQDAMKAWISASTKYPAEAYKNKISGRVFVNFIVSTAGKVKDVKVVKSAHPLLDAEAVRVISGMPEWKPGMQRGKAVDVRYTVPVEFTLVGMKVLK
jgi:TonB family protein